MGAINQLANDIDLLGSAIVLDILKVENQTYRKLSDKFSKSIHSRLIIAVALGFPSDQSFPDIQISKYINKYIYIFQLELKDHFILWQIF